ncbi:MAG: DegT/DnrJ/EryC1/StrS family aminotransferase, partial [Gammaproteobacteria bacterium]|nr:DegT/DnrJ/EryC1/StrS family aminotransferase [Gammaproteobacteria bacterium]
PDGPWYYEQITLGFNYRMTDMQAALGLSQMARLEAFVAQRHRLAARYDALLEDLPVTRPWQHPDGYSGLHLYVIRLAADAPHRDVFERLRAAGVGVNLHYIPVHTQPYYRQLGFRPGDFPEAERYYREAISLPMYPGLTFDEQDQVVAALRGALS